VLVVALPNPLPALSWRGGATRINETGLAQAHSPVIEGTTWAGEKTALDVGCFLARFFRRVHVAHLFDYTPSGIKSCKRFLLTTFHPTRRQSRGGPSGSRLQKSLPTFRDGVTKVASSYFLQFPFYETIKMFPVKPGHAFHLCGSFSDAGSWPDGNGFGS